MHEVSSRATISSIVVLTFSGISAKDPGRY
jgi:hypothetical protein